MTCQRCQVSPGFHSFEFVGVGKGIHYFYCYPAHNKQSVRTHEDMLNFVSHFPKDKPWSLLFHANGYGISNMMPLPIALEMGRIVQQQYNGNLQKIYIIEGHWFFQFLLQCIFPFLQRKMREKFVLVRGSLLEVLTEFQALDLTLDQLQIVRNRFG